MALMVDGEVIDRYFEPTAPLRQSTDGSATLEPAELCRQWVDMKARFGHQPFDRIVVSCQMGSFLFVDKRGRAQSPVVSWQDRRVLLAKNDGFPIYLEMKEQVQELDCPLWDGTGPQLPLFYLKRMIDCEPELRHQHLVSLGQFALSCLGSEKDLMRIPIGVTEAAASGLFDPVAKAWIDPLVDYIGLSTSSLPALISDHTEDFESSPAAIGDFQAAILGVDLRINEVYVNVSTGGQVAVFCDDPAHEVNWFGRRIQIRPFLGDRLVSAFTHLPAGRLLTSLYSTVVGDEVNSAGGQPFVIPKDSDTRIAVEFDRGLTGDFSIRVKGFDRLSPVEIANAIESEVIRIYDSLVSQLLNAGRASVVLSGGLLASHPRLLSSLRDGLANTEVRTVTDRDASLSGLEKFCLMGDS